MRGDATVFVFVAGEGHGYDDEARADGCDGVEYAFVEDGVAVGERDGESSDGGVEEHGGREDGVLFGAGCALVLRECLAGAVGEEEHVALAGGAGVVEPGGDVDGALGGEFADKVGLVGGSVVDSAGDRKGFEGDFGEDEKVDFAVEVLDPRGHGAGVFVFLAEGEAQGDEGESHLSGVRAVWSGGQRFSGPHCSLGVSYLLPVGEAMRIRAALRESRPLGCSGIVGFRGYAFFAAQRMPRWVSVRTSGTSKSLATWPRAL